MGSGWLTQEEKAAAQWQLPFLLQLPACLSLTPMEWGNRQAMRFKLLLLTESYSDSVDELGNLGRRTGGHNRVSRSHGDGAVAEGGEGY